MNGWHLPLLVALLLTGPTALAAGEIVADGSYELFAGANWDGGVPAFFFFHR